ncbi:hypothetical protein SynRS9909_01299 [Synechococcus sp. RS9909]|nr:hypothetical protein SynRS9909_01299 [Synechococcus sp. RS9909]
MARRIEVHLRRLEAAVVAAFRALDGVRWLADRGTLVVTPWPEVQLLASIGRF